MKTNQFLFASLILPLISFSGALAMDKAPQDKNFLGNFINNEYEFNQQLSMLNPSNPSERAHIESFLKEVDPKIEKTRTWSSENPSSPARVSKIFRLRALGLLAYGCGLSFIPTIIGGCTYLKQRDRDLIDLYRYNHRYHFGPTDFSLSVPYKLIVPAAPIGIGLGYYLFKKAKPDANKEVAIKKNLEKLKSLVAYRTTAGAMLEPGYQLPKIQNRRIETALAVVGGALSYGAWVALASFIDENKKSSQRYPDGSKWRSMGE